MAVLYFFSCRSGGFQTEPQVVDFSGSALVGVALGAALGVGFGGLNGRDSGRGAWFLRVWLL
jgi:hypothetical protein